MSLCPRGIEQKIEAGNRYVSCQVHMVSHSGAFLPPESLCSSPALLGLDCTAGRSLLAIVLLSFSRSVVSDSLVTVWTVARQAPLSWILQARMLGCVAISPSRFSWKVKVKSLSHVRLFATPWTVACQAPPSMGFSRQEYWSGLGDQSHVSCMGGRVLYR